MDKTDWIYCRIVARGNTIFPHEPFWLGQVELGRPHEDDPECLRALAESMRSYSVVDTNTGWAQLVHARLLLPNVTADDAQRFGSFHLTETLGTFNAHLSHGMSTLRATDAGYLYDLRSRRALALTPIPPDPGFTGAFAMMDDVAHHPLHIINTLFAAPDAFGELGHGFRRSSHWRELANRADDEGEALLLHWMAAECLCRVSDEPIPPKLLAAAGFPTGRIAKALAPGTRSALVALPNHRSWRRALERSFDALRSARNRIVHAGYRHVDLPSVLSHEHRQVGRQVLPIVTRALAEMALQALNLRLRTVDEMWSHYETVVNYYGPVRHAQWFIGRLEGA